MSSDNEDGVDGPSGCAETDRDAPEVDDAAEDYGEFGDDFDDFEEGGDGDDFGDFDDGFQQGEEDIETTFDKPPEQPSIPAPSLGPVSQQYSTSGGLPAEAPVPR